MRFFPRRSRSLSLSIYPFFSSFSPCLSLLCIMSMWFGRAADQTLAHHAPFPSALSVLEWGRKLFAKPTWFFSVPCSGANLWLRIYVLNWCFLVLFCLCYCFVVRLFSPAMYLNIFVSELMVEDVCVGLGVFDVVLPMFCSIVCLFPPALCLKNSCFVRSWFRVSIFPTHFRE